MARERDVPALFISGVVSKRYTRFSAAQLAVSRTECRMQSCIRASFKEELFMSRKTVTAAIFAAVAAGFFALPANAAPASPGNLAAGIKSESARVVQAAGYRSRHGGYRRHGGGIRLYLGGGHRRNWVYGGGRRGHGYNSYRGGYGGGHGGGHNR